MDNESMMALSKQLEVEFDSLVENCLVSGAIDLNLYQEYDVKRGLRDSSGKGVLTGLTEISDVTGYDVVNGVKEPADGKLFYQGYDVKNLVGYGIKKKFAFEETTYLLLFGKLPTAEQLEVFIEIVGSLQELSGQFVRDVIMKAPSANLMNGLQKSVLTLYSYDSNPDDISIPNVLRQSLQLIAKLPLIAVYNYHAYRHFNFLESLVIKPPIKGLSTAENILQMLRPDGKYTELEARVLDAALVLHAEHGGGNNSTFTNHVVTSSGTDTYSSVVSSLGSLKGPKHGGANIKVVKMFDDIKEHVKDWDNQNELSSYVDKILHKEAFDRTGLVYGMGHAVYSLSDPRAKVFKKFVEELSVEKHMEKEYKLMADVERIAAELIAKERKIYKGVSANVDFYSGFVYRMLGLPTELYTPIFAVARISGWSAHRIEELINCNKIIRPAYMNVCDRKEYVDLKDR